MPLVWSSARKKIPNNGKCTARTFQIDVSYLISTEVTSNRSWEFLGDKAMFAIRVKTEVEGRIAKVDLDKRVWVKISRGLHCNITIHGDFKYTDAR